MRATTAGKKLVVFKTKWCDRIRVMSRCFRKWEQGTRAEEWDIQSSRLNERELNNAEQLVTHQVPNIFPTVD